MKYNELKKLTPYRITKPSSDGTFLTGEMICVFRNKIMFINGKGSIHLDLCNESVLDFEAYESKDYKEFFEGINQYFSQGTANSLTQADLSHYSKSLSSMKDWLNSEVGE